MDEVMTQFDPRDKANISWNAPQDSLDYDAKVTLNFRQLERNWREPSFRIDRKQWWF